MSYSLFPLKPLLIFALLGLGIALTAAIVLAWSNPASKTIAIATATLFGAAEKLLEAIGTHLDGMDRAEADRDIAVTRRRLGNEAFESAWAAGRAMSLENAIAFALEATSWSQPLAHSKSD